VYPAAALGERFPKRGDVVANWRDDTHAGDDYSSFAHDVKICGILIRLRGWLLGGMSACLAMKFFWGWLSGFKMKRAGGVRSGFRNAGNVAAARRRNPRIPYCTRHIAGGCGACK
jgi:hypothetical protein